MKELRNLGDFESLDEVWKRFPEGGYEGDYLTVGGQMHWWNKYLRRWLDDNTPVTTPGENTQKIYGNLHVEKNLIVNGNLYAEGINQPYCGLFEHIEALAGTFPNPTIGMWAHVGTAPPCPIYQCKIPGIWQPTGLSGLFSTDTFFLDLSEIGPLGYINLGERGLTREFIEAMALGAEKKHIIIVKQGSNTTHCTYGGFFRPYGQEGGNLYLISLNFQKPQYIQLWQGTDKIKVMTQHLVRSGDLPEVVTLEEVEEIINNLN